jgi:hypothetical protein
VTGEKTLIQVQMTDVAISVFLWYSSLLTELAVFLETLLHSTKSDGRKTLKETAGHMANELSVKGNWRTLRGTKQHGSGENYITRSLMICNPHPVLFGD